MSQQPKLSEGQTDITHYGMCHPRLLSKPSLRIPIIASILRPASNECIHLCDSEIAEMNLAMTLSECHGALHDAPNQQKYA